MIPLAKATAYANKIASEISAMCALPPMITGSIRRGKPEVGDIDIVCVPTDCAAISARCKIQARRVMMDGAQRFSAEYAGGVQLDLFFAHQGKPDMFDPQPSNLGAVTLYSTGSKEHNEFLCAYAHRLGLAFDPWRGLIRNGRVIAGDSEERIYRLLQIPYIDPEDRASRATIQAAIERWAHAETCKAIVAPGAPPATC